MKLFFVTPPSHTHTATKHSQHNTEQCHKTHQRQMTPSAEPLTSCCSSARKPIAHTLSSCASYLQRHKRIFARSCQREHSSLTVCCRVCGAARGLGFGFCLELRRSSNLVSGILMKGERSTKTPPLKCKLSSPLPPSLCPPFADDIDQV